MGERAAETVKEIEEVRDRLGDEIEELGSRLPAPARLAKRAAGIAVGGGLAGSAFWFAVKRLRNRPKTPLQKAKRKVEDAVPKEWVKAVESRLGDDRTRRWALAAAGGWVLFRLAELRQLRKMNEALLSGRS